MYLNEVNIIGNLTRKPELKVFEGGQLTRLAVAINKVWYDKNTKEKKESCEYIDITVFGKSAELCAQYLEKGQKVFVKGFIKNRVEESADGKRYHTGIVAERVQFGPKSGGGSTNVDVKAKHHTDATTAPHVKAESLDDIPTSSEVRSRFTPPIDYPEEEINLEDIPF